MISLLLIYFYYLNKMKLSDAIVDTINQFRANPISSQKSLQIVSKALAKSKKTEESKKVDEFANSLASLQNFSFLNKSKLLTSFAEEQLQKVLRAKKPLLSTNLDSSLKDSLNPQEIVVESDADNLISQIVLNSEKDKDFVKSLLSNSHHIGVAASEGEANYIVIYMAEKVEEEQEEDYGDDKELKEAFDLFDVYSTGLLDEKALKDAFVALGFEKDSYSIYSAILRLNGNNKVKKQGGVDWETFRDTIKDLVGDLSTKEGTRKIFELFIDDPKQDTINSDSLKRLAHDLGEELNNKELYEIMKRVAENGTDVGFDEFYKIMSEYKELHTEA